VAAIVKRYSRKRSLTATVGRKQNKRKREIERGKERRYPTFPTTDSELLA